MQFPPLAGWIGLVAFAAMANAAEPRKIIVGGSYTNLADFEQFAARARQSGATHVRISDSLPWSYWQYDNPNDPYPSWVISHPTRSKRSGRCS